MRYINLALVVGALFAALGAEAQRATPAVSMRRVTANGVPVVVVEADLTRSTVHVTVQLARGGIGTAEPAPSMLARSRPVAAINGAYFSKTDLRPIGDIVVDGQQMLRGWFKTALAIDREGARSCSDTRSARESTGPSTRPCCPAARRWCSMAESIMRRMPETIATRTLTGVSRAWASG